MKKQVILDKIGTLYNFVEQGTTQATDESHRAAFCVMKSRMITLFPEYFEVVK
jgi:hypothetical protein